PACVDGGGAVHDGAVVPQYEIADAPFLVPGEALLRGVRPYRIQQLLAVPDREPVNIGARPPAEEQRLALAHRMKANQRMHRPRRVADIERALEAFAQLARRVAAGIVDAGL